jgi:hypothetical protein
MGATAGLDVSEEGKFFTLPGIEPRGFELLPRIISGLLSELFSLNSFECVDAGCVTSSGNCSKLKGARVVCAV